VAALTFEGFRANVGPLDPRVQAARPAPGQAAAARGLLALLEGGDLAGRARRVQDPVSLRCTAQVHGSVRAALDFAWAALEPELNGSGDNPLVLADGGGGEIRSTGNFHTPALALAFDTLALALAQLSAMSAARMQRLLAPSLSGLPASLSPYGPERSGLAPLSKTAEALATEIRALSAPVSTDPRYGAEMVEDDSTNAALGARRLARLLGLLGRLTAVEAVAAAQAVDLVRDGESPGVLGRGPAFLHEAIRRVVPRLDDDRPSGPDVERVAGEVLGSPEVRRTLAAMAAPG
jgi:histidine ammonia-lyase